MTFLDKLNCSVRNKRPIAGEDKKFTIWRNQSDFVQLCFQSRGCRYSELGSCLMCDYGRGRNLGLSEVTDFFDSAQWRGIAGCQELLLGTYGSMLDDYEIPGECFQAIIRAVKNTKIPRIGFETHCDTVISEKLEQIKSCFSDRNIYIEMGYESSSKLVRERYLNKKLKLETLEKAIKLIHEYDFESILNVFVGAPFLETEQQIDDVCASVRWAFNHGADWVILFPSNVKPYTLLYSAMMKQIYKPISQWMVVLTLKRLAQMMGDWELEHIGLSWYGDRGDIYGGAEHPMIPPVDCPVCHDAIMRFYSGYLAAESGAERRGLIDKMWGVSQRCGCRKEAAQSVRGV